MVAITVDATWRTSRIEAVMPYSDTGSIVGKGEVLLQQSSETYGVMPGAQVTRIIGNVKDETVDLEGTIVSVATALAALQAFMERWRLEDEALSLPSARVDPGNVKMTAPDPAPPIRVTPKSPLIMEAPR